MVEGTSVGLPPQDYVYIKQPKLIKNHVTHIHRYHIALKFIFVHCKLHKYKTSFIDLHKCCINPYNFVWLRWGTVLNPIFETKLDDTTFMQLLLSTMILQFLPPFFIQVWKIVILRQSLVSLGCTRVHLTIPRLMELRNSSCLVSLSELLVQRPITLVLMMINSCSYSLLIILCLNSFNDWSRY